MIRICSELSSEVYNYATEKGLEYRLYSEEGQVYLVFAGSEDLEDWLINFNSCTIEGVYAGIVKSLNEQLEEIIDQLEYYLVLENTTTVNITGHSAGGAFAVWMSMRLDRLSSNLNIRCVTFGQPPMFSKYADLSGYSFIYYRIGNQLDPILRFPINLVHRPVGRYHEILFWDFRFLHSAEGYARRFS